MFDISFVKLPESSEEPVCRGRIRIGDFTEEFEPSLDFWGQKEYEQHWRQSISRVVSEDSDSCLITSLTDPRTANFLFWWPIYVISDSSVVVQHHVLFLDECRADFDLHSPHLCLRSRRIVSDEGENISEWRLTIDELADWLRVERR